MLRSLARKVGRVDVTGRLVPGRRVVPREVAAVDVTEAAGSRGLRTPTGADPHLVFAPPPFAALPSGAVEISWDLVRETSTPIEPELYVDAGAGFSEGTKILLPTTMGGRLCVPIELPLGLRHLRIDVPPDTGPFALRNLRLRRLATADEFDQPLWHGPEDAYPLWVAATEAAHAAARESSLAEIAEMDGSPRFSIVVPVHDPPVEILREAIESVLGQLWPHWELCICDDASRDPEVTAFLDEVARDPRVRLVRREVSGNISAASNDALALATGDWVVLLDHDDLLHSRALFEVAKTIRVRPDAAIVYSDEDKIDPGGRRFDPYFKPQVTPELFWGQNLVSHLGAFARADVVAVGGFRSAFDGSQDYDLALRVIERRGFDAVVHVPSVLYHWRVLPGSLALGDDEKTWAHDAATRALAEHLERTGIDAEITQAAHTRYRRVIPKLADPDASVTIVIPTRDRADLLEACVRSLQANTTHRGYDLLLVDNGSVDTNACALLEELAREPGIRVLRDDGDFNYSRLNNLAAREATGTYLCLLNDDIEVVEGEWLTELLRWGQLPAVGAVGARLDYPDGRLQHAGVVLGLGGEAAHAYQQQPGTTDGQMGRAKLVQQYQAVTGACLLTPRALYLEVGGLDEVDLAVAYNDIDYCLRLRQHGHTVLWTPFARLLHHESASRGPEVGAREVRRAAEAAVLRERWVDAIAEDPFFNPNLSRRHTDFRPRQLGYQS